MILQNLKFEKDRDIIETITPTGYLATLRSNVKG